MASVLPSNLSFFMSRLQGVATSHFKINSQTSNTGTANRIVRFELPSNTLLNFRSLRLFFQIKTTGTGASAPPDTSSFIERCSVYVGGVLVANGFNGYNTLVHAKAALQGSKCGTLAHPEMVRSVSYHTFGTDGAGTALTGTDNEDYATSSSLKEDLFCIDNFEGFLGSCEPAIMDTGALATIVIEFALADNAIITSSAGRNIGGTATSGFDVAPTTPSSAYELSNMTMQVEVLSLASNVIDTIVEQRISQVGYLSVPFKNYFSFANTHSGSTRFNVNSASWDRLWVAYRDSTYGTTGAPIRVKGYKKAGCFTSATTANSTYLNTQAVQDIGVPEYDIGGLLNTNSEKYKPKYFNFEEKKASLTTLTTYQLQINSANIPSYPMNAVEALAMSMNSLDYYDKNHKLTLHQYKNNYFVQVFRFCLPDSDYSRLASGLDCRGVSSSCALNTTGVDSCNVMLFAECTSELRIGAGRQIEVVV